MSLPPAMPRLQLRPRLYASGFSWRKRALLRQFSGRRDIRFITTRHGIEAGSDLLLWGAAAAPAGTPASTRLVRVEDGFIRSVGLGADLVRPLSWVLDASGMYYDPREPSDLERMLERGLAAGDAGLLGQASALRQRLVDAGIDKYNLSGPEWSRPAAARHVVLVVGQVETDASIGAGAIDIRTNAALLQAVRQARPDAWLVYKPHPDVIAGLRGEGVDERDACVLADEVLGDGSMARLIGHVDEVHVMTSLAGFEALLRGKPVYCHGQPFYAGWGLTSDRHPHARRTRRVSLDELVACALLCYPTYVSRRGAQLCTAGQAVQELLDWRARERVAPVAWWRRILRPLLARP